MSQDELAEGADGGVAGHVPFALAAHAVGHGVETQRVQVEMAAELGREQ